MALADALDALAALTVPGVNHNYNIGEVPRRIPRAALPILFLIPMIDELEKQRVSGMRDLTVTGSSTVSINYVTHILLINTPGASRYWDTLMRDLLDAYQQAITEDLRLNDTLFRPLVYAALPGMIVVNGAAYNGVRFLHELQISKDRTP